MEQMMIELAVEEDLWKKVEVIARYKGCTPEKLIEDYMRKSVERYEKTSG